MIIGIPRSRTSDEYRVGLPPRAVSNLVEMGVAVLLEKNAGAVAGFSDAQYESAGAGIVHSLDEIYGRSDIIVKVNRPEPSEYRFIRENQILMSVMHLAVADPDLIDILVEKKCTAIDFVTIQDEHGHLPVLRPLSQIAGRMVPQIASRYLQTDHGGMGILFGGAPAVPPAEVVIIGAGSVGRNAVRACVAAGARVTLLDNDFDRISEIDWTFPGQVTTFQANEATLRKVLGYANVVVGAVLIPGTKTPHLVTKEMISLLREGSLIIDISVDQGGCFETSRPTRISDPVYVVDGITHYCVPNLPSLVARSATYALANATLPIISAVASGDLGNLLKSDTALMKGVNVMGGHITHAGLAVTRGYDFKSVDEILSEEK